MQILVDPLKLLEIPKTTKRGNLIEKKFTSGLSHEDIFSKNFNGKFTIKFCADEEVIGSVVVEPKELKVIMLM